MTARRFGGVLGASFVVAAALRFGAPPSQSFVSNISKQLRVAEIQREPERIPRRVYAFSVIPGGAYSREELAVALKVDPVAAEHYAGFDASNASTRRLAEDTYVYVSYRKGDRVYWTASKRRIPKGELVLSDGKHLARTRCGNRLSGIPESPVDHAPQPTELALNAPELPSGIKLPDAPLLVPEYDAPSIPLAGSIARDFAFPMGTPGLSVLPKGFPDMVLGSPYMTIAGLPVGISQSASKQQSGSGKPGKSITSVVGPGTPGPAVGETVPEPRMDALLGLAVLLLVIGGRRIVASR